MLEIKNLTIKYDSNILDNVSITFPRGAVTVIKGPSGSGKSSLLNVLGLIQKPNPECSYSLDGQNINFNDEAQKAKFRLKKVGFVFQQNNLLQELKTIDNVMLPMNMLSKDYSYAKEQAQKWIDYIGLTKVSNNYPASLSGGEEQRVAIARALMNDADIILADEPTASLDLYNSNIILELFKKLARELNKIVIIVSHDEKVAEIADAVYEIKDFKLKTIKTCANDIRKTSGNSEVEDKKNIYRFITHYTKNRRKEKRLNLVLIIITAIIAAVATLFINFGDSFSKQQKDFINAISERSMFVINDTLGLNSQTDYGDALKFSEEDLKKIKTVPNVNKIYSYYEFTSFGITKQNTEKAEINIFDKSKSIKEVEYSNPYIYSNQGAQFRILPLYPEEQIGNLLEYTSNKNSYKNGFILTSAFAKTLSDNPSNLIGKSMEIKCFVPVKLYDSQTTKPSGKNGTKNEETLKIDGAISKLVSIKKEITGILPNSYSYQRSEENKNIILLDYNEMSKILSENKEIDYQETFSGFPEKELGPSALVIYGDSYEDISNIKAKIENISPTINVISKGLDVHRIQDNIHMIKNIMRVISLILIIIVMIMFYFVYYFKNRTRKKEIGILKAIGLTTKDVVFLVAYEMARVATKTFILSMIVATFLMVFGNFIIGSNDIFTISISSVAFSFFLSFFIVIVSGISSIWKTSRIDIIDAIRNNK
ncbi:ABC transporter ATP-binding protein/permease [Clostridium sp. 19966]|uniref:ABC transporter ATP-binding protein/permease n=1 Tax=Clostridium sp. 19966 TaxID=2768166 RepID=UPI0028E01F81|nr:ABC transporter ATP-binding protein/permease [Clostridium sp. 19966]MDT8717162.1 ABC transporter ATP-binding protein/permease [Clostridium sp. 19966]